MSSFAMNAAAAFVLRSLYDHPGLRTSEAIAAGPEADGTFDVPAVERALGELRDRGLAEDEPGGGWRLTEAGRERMATGGAGA